MFYWSALEFQQGEERKVIVSIKLLMQKREQKIACLQKQTAIWRIWKLWVIAQQSAVTCYYGLKLESTPAWYFAEQSCYHSVFKWDSEKNWINLFLNVV